MSKMIYKTVLRFPIPYKGNPGEVLNAIREETKGLLEGSETIYWYDDENDYEECSSWWLDNRKIELSHYDTQYSIDLILSKGEDYYDEVIPLTELNKAIAKICKLFGVDKKRVILHTYAWYTGVDEPWRIQ